MVPLKQHFGNGIISEVGDRPEVARNEGWRREVCVAIKGQPWFPVGLGDAQDLGCGGGPGLSTGDKIVQNLHTHTHTQIKRATSDKDQQMASMYPCQRSVLLFYSCFAKCSIGGPECNIQRIPLYCFLPPHVTLHYLQLLWRSIFSNGQKKKKKRRLSQPRGT